MAVKEFDRKKAQTLLNDFIREGWKNRDDAAAFEKLLEFETLVGKSCMGLTLEGYCTHLSARDIRIENWMVETFHLDHPEF